MNPLFAVAAVALAIGVASLLARKFPLPIRPARFESIDGLRGYLAFFVFVHHGCVWYDYLQTGQWELPNSNLYVHFGQGGVAVFFMITGFLFGTKLLRGRRKVIDWTALYMSRLLRLWPLYVFTICLVFLIVAALTQGKLAEPVPALLRGAAAWLGLTLYGAPDLNGLSKTVLIVAGVTWTLCYECLFYFSLPILAVASGAAVPARFLVIGVFGVTVIAQALWPIELVFLLPFLSGVLTVPLAQNAACRRFAARPVASCIVVVCLTALVLFFPSAYAFAPMVVLGVAFAIVACGNSLFGLLLMPASRTLGAMSYDIYLLPGIALYVTFQIAIGADRARILSPLSYWLVVLAITPLLLVICAATHRLIERPAMQLAARREGVAATRVA